MAIAPDILLAFLVDKDDKSHKIILQNTNPRFTKREIQIVTSNPKEPVQIDSKTLGMAAICEHLCLTKRMEQLL